MKKVLCLLYHRVNIIDDKIFNLAVTPEHFKEQMNYIKNNYNILKFDDDWNRGEDNAVVVTFDDGYADNFIYALPILEKEKVPATVFVSTGYVSSNKEYWWDELTRLLTMDKNYPYKFTLNDALYSYSWETDTIGKRLELIKSLHWLLRMEPDYRLAFEWFEQIKKWADIDDTARTENLPVSLRQLMRLSDSEYITLGAHTVNHISLGALTKEQQEYEIGESIRLLSKYTKRSIDTFSFPFGAAADYNIDTIDLCKKYGIKKAATTNASIWKSGESLYKIPRISVSDCKLDEFAESISKYMED